MALLTTLGAINCTPRVPGLRRNLCAFTSIEVGPLIITGETRHWVVDGALSRAGEPNDYSRYPLRYRKRSAAPGRLDRGPGAGFVSHWK